MMPSLSFFTDLNVIVAYRGTAAAVDDPWFPSLELLLGSPEELVLEYSNVEIQALMERKEY